MASVATQVTKCIEYDDLSESKNNINDCDLSPDLPETTDNTGRQSKILDIKVKIFEKRRECSKWIAIFNI